MRINPVVILAVFLLSSTTVGCLSNSEDNSGIELMVNYEFTNGTIVETYVDGDLQSNSNIILDFDFSTTSSEHELVSFCLLYTSPSPRDKRQSRMPSSA